MICRLCLNSLNEKISVPIFEVSRSEEKGAAYLISKHLSLELSSEDNISTSICQDCYDHLEDFHEFWLQIDQKQRTLQCEFLEIKCEEVAIAENINHENLIQLPPNEAEEISLINEKLEENDSKRLLSHISKIEGIDGSTEIRSILDCDVEIHDEDNLDASSDDEIPLMAYKTLVKEKKSIRDKSVLKSSKKKKKQKTEENINTFRDKSDYSKLKTSTIVDSLELSCDLCKENIGDFDNLRKHFAAKHIAKKAFVKCCRRTFTEKKKLTNHLHWHRNPEDYRCSVCKKVLSSKKYLKFHMSMRHEEENATVLNCELCDKTFHSRKRLNNHNRTHKNGENLSCHVCGKLYTSQNRLQRHIQGTHEYVYPYKCSACGEPFNFKADLDKHCDNCKNKSLLTRITAGEVIEEKVSEESICKICHKIFYNPAQLKRHINSIHEDVHPFVCDQCGKKFKFKPAFEKHLLEHSGIVEPPAQCNICGNWLKNKHSLRLHLYRHDDGNKKCHLCGRICASRRSLHGHMKNVHRDEKDYKCKYCDKSFKSPKNLEEHIAIHTGAQLYSCPHCQKETRSSSNMYVHIKRMHTEEWIKSKLARSNNPNVNISKNKSDE